MTSKCNALTRIEHQVYLYNLMLQSCSCSIALLYSFHIRAQCAQNVNIFYSASAWWVVACILFISLVRFTAYEFRNNVSIFLVPVSDILIGCGGIFAKFLVFFYEFIVFFYIRNFGIGNIDLRTYISNGEIC